MDGEVRELGEVREIEEVKELGEVTDTKTVTIILNHQPSGGREWVAELTGLHPKYNFARNFLKPVERGRSSTGKTGWTKYKLEDGKVYEWNSPYKGRGFVKVVDGRPIYISAEEAFVYFENLQGESEKEKGIQRW